MPENLVEERPGLPVLPLPALLRDIAGEHHQIDRRNLGRHQLAEIAHQIRAERVLVGETVVRTELGVRDVQHRHARFVAASPHLAASTPQCRPVPAEATVQPRRREGETGAADQAPRATGDQAPRAPGRRRWSRGDIQPLGPPAIPAEDWHDPAAVLDRLRGWAQQHTTETIRWYL